MPTIVRNRTWSFDATLYDVYVAEGDPGNVPTNHTDWTIRSQIRTKVGNKLVANLNVTFPVPTAGTVAIRHDRDFTRSLKAGDYWWDVVATDPTGQDHVYVEPETMLVRDHPTDPDDADYDFVPGGGGAVMHKHVIADVTGLQAALNGKAPLSHTHSIADVTGLQAAIDGKAPLAHTHVIADVLGLQDALDALAGGGGGGATAFVDLTDAASADLPSINTPLATALSGKLSTSGTAADVNPAGTAIASALAGKASLAGNNTFTAQQSFTDATTWSYTTSAASAHRTALGAGTTGAELFQAATAAAANSTLGNVRGVAASDVTATTQNVWVDVASVALTTGTWRVMAFYHGANASSSATNTRLSSSANWSDTNGRRIGVNTGSTTINGITFVSGGGGTSSAVNVGTAGSVSGEIGAVVKMTGSGTLSLQVTNTAATGTATGYSGSHIIATKLD